MHLFTAVVCASISATPTVSKLKANGPKELTAAEVFRLVSPSVVTLTTKNTKGSGVLVNGMIVTNAHVVEGPIFRYSNEVPERPLIEAARIGWGSASAGTTGWTDYLDRGVDLAVLAPHWNRPEDEPKSAPLILRQSGTLEIGERVYAIGAPLGLERTMSEGIVSGVRTVAGDQILIQTTAALSHGSSGGGLFDRFGRLLGITTGSLVDGQSLNLVVPAEDVERIFRAKEGSDEQMRRENEVLVAARDVQPKGQVCYANSGRTKLDTVCMAARVLLDGRMADIHPNVTADADRAQGDRSLLACMTGLLHAVKAPPQKTSWIQTFCYTLGNGAIDIGSQH